MYYIFHSFEYLPGWLSGLRRQSGNLRTLVRIQVIPINHFCNSQQKIQISTADFTLCAHSDGAHFDTHYQEHQKPLKKAKKIMVADFGWANEG